MKQKSLKRIPGVIAILILILFTNGANAQFTDGQIEGGGLWFGGIGAWLTSGGNNQLFDGGGGLTLGLETPAFLKIGAKEMSCVTNLDLLWREANGQVQLNEPGGVDQEANNAFGVHFRPGLLGRCQIPTAGPNALNIVYDGRFFVGYDSGNSQIRNYDPSKVQVLVNSFKQNDWPVGWGVGGGFEWICRSGYVIRPMVHLNQYTTDFLTGKERTETELMVSAEILLMTNIFNRRGLITTPRIIIQEEEEKYQ